MILHIGRAFIILLFIFSTAIARHTKVDRLVVTGVYRSPNCNVNVTCYVHAENILTEIKWSSQGGPRNTKDLTQIPGFTVGPKESPTFNRLQQTISIKKCYNRLELKCKVSGSSKSVTLYSGTGIPLRIIIGIVVGVLIVAIGIGAFFIRKRRRAAAKANTTEAVTLNPPPDSYPIHTTNMYPQDTMPSAYPQESMSTYPPQSGPFYPEQQAPLYPPQPATAYPQPPATAYQQQPATAYPYQQQPATAYPYQQQPATAYPYPQQPATAYPYPQQPATNPQQPLLQDPPPYPSGQPPPAGFK